MKNSIKLSLYINYFVFAILLNSVGAVILQVQRNFDVTKGAASVLEGFKDLPIAFVSFLVASFLPRYGLKKSMVIGLGLVSVFCFVMPFANDFWYFKMLFLVIGVSFALIKVTVYATIGLVTDGTKGHSSFMSSLEGVFMVGVLLGNVLFSLFIDDANPKSAFWLNTYWILGALSLLALLLLLRSKLDESQALKEGENSLNGKEMFGLIFTSKVFISLLVTIGLLFVVGDPLATLLKNSESLSESFATIKIVLRLAIVFAYIMYVVRLRKNGSEENSVANEGRLVNQVDRDFMSMFKLIVLPLVLVFILGVFLFVLIEQSFQTWTPTFYEDILKVPASMSIQAGAVLAGAFAIGRFAAGFILKKVHWFVVVSVCIIGCAAVVLIALPLTKGLNVGTDVTWLSAPLVAYLFPLMGVFLSPIYPSINSVILSSLPNHMHSAMSGLIVVFSALGGTTGSIITGNVFERYDGQTAFYMSLIPMALLLIALFFLKKLTEKAAAEA